MYTYDIAGNVLTLHPKATPTDNERHEVYQAIIADPQVPTGVLVILDLGRMDAPVSLADLEHRTRLLVAELQPKLGPVCAVIVPPRLETDIQPIRLISDQLGVRFALFHDEDEAKGWLGRYGG